MAAPEMNSPPKPRRLVDFSNGVIQNGPAENDKITKQAGDELLMQFEESLVDRAVSDLPNIASQVFSLNKDHSSEIKRQKDLLVSLQEKVKEGKKMHTVILISLPWYYRRQFEVSKRAWLDSLHSFLHC